MARFCDLQACTERGRERREGKRGTKFLRLGWGVGGGGGRGVLRGRRNSKCTTTTTTTFAAWVIRIVR